MSLVKIEKVSSKVTTVTLNRPEKRNALNIELLEELTKVFTDVNNDENTLIIILKGEGSIFCAGLDLVEATIPEKIEKSGELLAKGLNAIYTSPKITIASVQGAALAGGAGYMSACDFVIAAEGTKIGYPETRRGLVAALMMSILIRQVKIRDMMELLLVEEWIDPQRAKEMGLINKVVPQEKLDDELLLLSNKILEGAPKATLLTKELVQVFEPTNFQDDISKALDFHQLARNSEEAKEGAKAFIEKRNPKW